MHPAVIDLIHFERGKEAGIENGIHDVEVSFAL
jgi:hypothetical protein